MNFRKSNQTLWALTLALAALGGGTAREARADAMLYNTVGYVDTPVGATPGLISFTGTSGTVSAQGSVNLGSFVVSPAALTGAPVNFTGVNFYDIVYAGNNQSELVSGTFNGSIGSGVTTPLTATINSVTPFTATSNPLPFTLSVPTGVAFTLNTTAGAGGASTTIFTAAAAPIPEPASVAVFAVALGSLALWRRKAAR